MKINIQVRRGKLSIFFLFQFEPWFMVFSYLTGNLSLAYIHGIDYTEGLLYNCGRIFFILSFFVGYILSFGLIRLRTIRLSAWVEAHIERRCSCSHREDVTITDVIIKTPAWDWEYEWRHSQRRWSEDFGWFLKKAVKI